MDAKELLMKFIAEKLGGNIEELADYDMEGLKGDKEFGCTRGCFEYDNTELVKALFVVLWHDLFAKKGIRLDLDTVGDGKAFRGDTIHTSGALLGQKHKDDDKYEGLNDRYKIDDEELMNCIRAWPVSRIGNMLLLPARSLCVTNANDKNAYVTINTFRGYASGWHDYFDRFLVNLREVMKAGIPTETTENEISLPNIMSLPVNRSYFACFGSFEKWMEQMMLNDYYQDQSSGELKKLFNIDDFKDYPYHWRYRKIDAERKKRYCDYVRQYLENTKNLINSRSHLMVEKLKTIL